MIPRIICQSLGLFAGILTHERNSVRETLTHSYTPTAPCYMSQRRLCGETTQMQWRVLLSDGGAYSPEFIHDKLSDIFLTT